MRITAASATRGIINFFKSKFQSFGTVKQYKPMAGEAPEYTILKSSLLDNMTYLNGQFDGCADFVTKEFVTCGHNAAILEIDNMIDKLEVTQSILEPLIRANPPVMTNVDDRTLFDWLRDNVLSSIDQKESYSYEEVIGFLMAGFVIVLIDGVDKAFVFGLQGFKFRSIEEPSTDKALRGSREGFIEPLHFNMMLVRRRIKNENLKFEIYRIGNESKSEVCIAYIKNTANESMLNEVRHRLKSIDLDTVLGSGYIQNYFQDDPFSIFSTVGATERPDTFCGRLNEGQIGVIMDNSPWTLTMPYLFVDNFQNLDDYTVSPYYATFTRILKYVAFFTSVLIPALYVAVGSFHQSLLPSPLLYTLASAEESTPFSLVFEAIFMQVVYEMIREAGLRAPSQFGFAINIVGALVIGQAAVSAGLIGAPMVIIVAITATSALIVPTLYEPGIILRFGFIVLAGMAGMYGIAIGVSFMALHLCAMKSYDVPYTSPISPFSGIALRDVAIRVPWKMMSKRKMTVQDLPGSNVDKTQG